MKAETLTILQNNISKTKTTFTQFWSSLYDICPRGHRRSRGTYEHDERSCPTESLTRAMFSGVIAVFFSHFCVVVSFFWLLGSDPVAKHFLTHLKISSFDGTFLKLYFTWISPARFYKILTQNIKWHKNFLLVIIFNSFKDPQLLWFHLFKSEKE